MADAVAERVRLAEKLCELFAVRTHAKHPHTWCRAFRTRVDMQCWSILYRHCQCIRLPVSLRTGGETRHADSLSSCMSRPLPPEMGSGYDWAKMHGTQLEFVDHLFWPYDEGRAVPRSSLSTLTPLAGLFGSRGGDAHGLGARCRRGMVHRSDSCESRVSAQVSCEVRDSR